MLQDLRSGDLGGYCCSFSYAYPIHHLGNKLFSKDEIRCDNGPMQNINNTIQNKGNGKHCILVAGMGTCLTKHKHSCTAQVPLSF